MLSSPNITNVFGAGEIEGQFCAAMEYVQGNSIATMLARKEGFSIWDLLDIGRQLCSGFDHAKSHNIVHYSLEPSKIMCGWDGTVRILGFGVSSVGNFVQSVPEGVPTILHYMSPEQVQGQATDSRSNLFSLGAMFYEMVTERKAFDREDAESLRQSILESTPVPPIHVNPKVHPGLSDLIMKALEKDPAKRYQTGTGTAGRSGKMQRVEDSGSEEAGSAQGNGGSGQDAGGGAIEVDHASCGQAGCVRSQFQRHSAAASRPAEKKSVAPAAVSAPVPSKLARPASSLAAPKAAAAAAGAGSSAVSGNEVDLSADVPEIDLSNQFITSCVKATIESSGKPSASMSSAVVDEPEVETFAPQEDDAPRIAVDPMMAEGGPKGASGVSFSEMTELPPLKEVYVAPPPPPSTSSYQPVNNGPAAATVFHGGDAKAEEKPKVQPRVVAQKAIKEIKGVPPKLMLYALSGAGILILLIGLGVTLYIHSLNDDDPGSKRPAPAAVEETPAPEPSQPAPKKTPRAGRGSAG